MKYVLITILLVAGVGIWLVANRAEAPESATMNPSETHTDVSSVSPEPMTDNGVDNPEPGAGEDMFAALVTYTDSGFEPAVVTIKKGETVRFVDQSTGGMWVASAKHPTHAVYPQKSETDCLGSSFDSCRALSAGEFWEFTFDEAGTWKYHNHVQPGHVGTVVVE